MLEVYLKWWCYSKSINVLVGDITSFPSRMWLYLLLSYFSFPTLRRCLQSAIDFASVNTTGNGAVHTGGVRGCFGAVLAYRMKLDEECERLCWLFKVGPRTRTHFPG